MRILGVTAFLIFVLDQAIKWFVVHWLNLKTLGAIDVMPPFLNLRMAWNHGINLAFSPAKVTVLGGF